MDNVVESIFGLSPAQIQQRQNVGMMTAANNYASQDPLQRAAASMFAGGGMLAGAGAQAAGMMTPEMQQAQMTEQALQGLDTSDPKAIFERAQQIQDPRLKFGLIKMGREIQAEKSKQALEAAHVKSYEMGGSSKGKYSPENIAALSNKERASKLMVARNTATMMTKDMNFPSEEARVAWVDGEVERADAAYLRANPQAGKTQLSPQVSPVAPQQLVAVPQSPMSISASNQTPTQLSPFSQIAMPEGNMPPEMIQAIRDDMQARGDTQGVSALPISQRPQAPTMAQSVEAKARAKATGEKDPEIAAAEKFAEIAAKDSAEQIAKQEDKVKVAAVSLKKLDELKAQLEKNDVSTGLAADFRKATNKMLALLGGREGARKATETEIADAMMGADVFPLIQSLGIGARGMDTPEERRFMRSVLTGDISLEKNTLLEMTRMRREAMQREIDGWDKRVDSGELNPYFKIPGKSKTKYGSTTLTDKLTSVRKYNPVSGRIE